MSKTTFQRSSIITSFSGVVQLQVVVTKGSDPRDRDFMHKKEQLEVFSNGNGRPNDLAAVVVPNIGRVISIDMVKL